MTQISRIQRRAAGAPQAVNTEWSPLVRGEQADIVILCDPPSQEAERDNLPMAWEALKFFSQHAMEQGFVKGDIAQVSLCPSMPFEIMKSASKKWNHVQPHAEKVLATVMALKPKIIVAMGELASRVILNRAVKITKARGVPVMAEHLGVPVLPMLSPGYVMRLPDGLPAFRADLNTLKRIKDVGFSISDIVVERSQYSWVHDLEPLMDQIQRVIAVDTETTGLRWHDTSTRVLTVQISPRPGVSWVMPVDAEYCRRWFPDVTEEQRLRLVDQIRSVMQNGAIRKMGHNFKFDNHMIRKMGIEVNGWLHDTQLMAFCIDENMMRKDLDECVRVWVPDMAGYADEFNRVIDKSRMIDVPPNDILDNDGNVVQHGMLNYAGGDTDATYRLAKVLDGLLRTDERQLQVYRRIMIPAILVFANSVERYGMLIDQPALRQIETELVAYTRDKYRELIRMVPPAVRKKHLDKGLEFTRDSFKRDILFSPEGFNLKPLMFTDSTKDLKDESQRVPAAGKDHLTYFVNDRRVTVATFCTEMIRLGAAEKMLSTYVGDEEEGSGFWKYIAADGNIYPSYMLHRTNTGRTASADPNGQNFPKRSPKGGPDWAAKYQGIFKSRPGWKLVNCDLSQIELRLVAWMANETTMLQVYRDDGDIHTTTAKAVLGYTDEAWEALSAKEKKDARFKAKAVNFGLIYGMSAKGFQVYAKTDYGLDLTLKEAEAIRETFFKLYPGLLGWHETMKTFASQHGYVRGLHGAVRHLPSIWSTDQGIRAQAERQSVNAPIQRLGSDMGLMAMIRFTSQMPSSHFRLIGFVHDALILEVREGYEEQGAAYLKWVMESPPLERWFGITAPIPIKAEAEIATGNTSASLQERPELQAVKPEWWNDNEDEVIQQFLAGEHVHVTIT